MHSSYLDGPFNVSVRRFAVSVLVRYLQPRLIAGDFTHIYVRGVSGITIGSMVAYELDAPLVVLRKAEKGQHHGDNQIEGLTGLAKCCIIDDLISTGKTIEIMEDRLKEGQLAGICLYQSSYVPKTFDNVWMQFRCNDEWDTLAQLHKRKSPTNLAKMFFESRFPNV